jgi:hypothetical protein
MFLNLSNNTSGFGVKAFSGNEEKVERQQRLYKKARVPLTAGKTQQSIQSQHQTRLLEEVYYRRSIEYTEISRLVTHSIIPGNEFDRQQE